MRNLITIILLFISFQICSQNNSTQASNISYNIPCQCFTQKYISNKYKEAETKMLEAKQTGDQTKYYSSQIKMLKLNEIEDGGFLLTREKDSTNVTTSIYCVDAITLSEKVRTAGNIAQQSLERTKRFPSDKKNNYDYMMNKIEADILAVLLKDGFSKTLNVIVASE